MSSTTHTYGPSCRLSRNVTFSGSKGGNDIPDLKAQFFYSSTLPIDDPLSAVPTPSGSDSKAGKHPPRPFSAYDNNALEMAWLGLASEKSRRSHFKDKIPKWATNEEVETRASIITRAVAKSKKRQNPEDDTDSSSTAQITSLDSETNSKALTPAGPSTKATKHLNLIDAGALQRSECRKGTTANSETRKTHDSHSEQRQVSIVTSNPWTCHCNKFKNTPGDSKTSRSRTNDSLPTCCSEFERVRDEDGLSNVCACCSELSKDDSNRKACAACLAVDKDAGSKPCACCSDLSRDGLDRKLCASDEIPADQPQPKIRISEPERDEQKSDKKGKEKKQTSHNLGVGPSREKSKRDGHDKEVKRASNDPRAGTAQVDGTGSSDDASDAEATNDTDGASDRKLTRAFRRSKEVVNVVEDAVGSAEAAKVTLMKGFQHAKEHLDNAAEDFMSSMDSTRCEASEMLNNLQEQGPQQSQETGQGQHSPSDSSAGPSVTNIRGQGSEAGTTGFPFLRAPSRTASHQIQLANSCAHGNENPNSLGISPIAHERDVSEELINVLGCKAHKSARDQVDIPVGISRLHLVKLPALQMKPIYWSPVHDNAAVTRGTWFYKDTMYPVEPATANQLEIGYRELRPWSQTWCDELHSAIEVGAAGEEKISYRLWPEESSLRLGCSKSSNSLLSTDPYCAARCFNGEAAAEGTVDDDKPSDTATIVKNYRNSYVIYKDSQNAFILKASLAPSSYYNRKPLVKIKRGTTVGVHVVRGFDWKTWEKLHPSKKTTVAGQAEESLPVTGNTDAAKSPICIACRLHEERPKVTDLVLVVHGIGQKLSERVESFHFTHAINAFRRSVNVELSNKAVQPVLRKDFGGVMVLPVNWRSNLSFEEGGPRKVDDRDKDHARPENFTLKDITPDTIPAVRNLISDVMLDIPFYMSKYKPKMIDALIKEANRVYGLWCKNNPEFNKDGRVHVIAHSLGSVMALDVLSKQPTFTPRYNFNEKRINTKYFDFDTTDLFLVGSPAGLFLLLERGNLKPRRGRSKPDAEQNDVHSSKCVTGEAGTFGCLAVDNIYNVMHQNDPIAYRLNAAVDARYAASLKDAHVPSSTIGFFESIGKAVKSIAPGISTPAELVVGEISKPAPIVRLPSSLEMEVHDFTREETAEKKFYLLNDNGQVDWFLSSGGGPLEIQYLNMLGAHSSYWLSPDFIRMIVTEIGRRRGRHHTLPNLKAVKMGQHKHK